MIKETPAPTAARMRDFRERMRARGMRLIQVWVPDTSSPSFAAEARRQSRLAKAHPSEQDAIRFLESIEDDGVWHR